MVPSPWTSRVTLGECFPLPGSGTQCLLSRWLCVLQKDVAAIVQDAFSAPAPSPGLCSVLRMSFYLPGADE